ncbi:MAG TPA: hypothetical protein VJ793_18425 [Anaerolineae bacterium]|nr:hypothetical protein [Anaerolineae bacterium]
MILLNIPFSVSGLAAVMVVLYILAALSRRLGAVTKMKPYYRGFYVAMACLAIAIGAAVLRRPMIPSDPSTPLRAGLSIYLFLFYLPLLLSGIIGLVVAYRYWGWLFRERI